MWRVYFARLLLLVAVLVGLVLLVGTLLPRSFHVEQSISIEAPRADVYSQIANLQQWLQWSPWSQVDAEIHRPAGEDAAGRAAIWWRDPRGDGKLWLDGLEPDTAVSYRLTAGPFPEGHGRIELRGDSPTEVRWTLTGRLPAGPFYGYFRLFFHAEMRQQFARSLERLEQLCEQPAPANN